MPRDCNPFGLGRRCMSVTELRLPIDCASLRASCPQTIVNAALENGIGSVSPSPRHHSCFIFQFSVHDGRSFLQPNGLNSIPYPHLVLNFGDRTTFFQIANSILAPRLFPLMPAPPLVIGMYTSSTPPTDDLPGNTLLSGVLLDMLDLNRPAVAHVPLRTSHTRF